MGSHDTEEGRYAVEGPVHQVRFPRDFYIARTEVTQSQYESVVGNNPSQFSDCSDCPVEYVSWLDAVRYCNELSELAELDTCYRLGEADADYELPMGALA